MTGYDQAWIEDKVVRALAALEVIAAALEKISEEGFTIYTHDDGPEAKN